MNIRNHFHDAPGYVANGVADRGLLARRAQKGETQIYGGVLPI